MGLADDLKDLAEGLEICQTNLQIVLGELSPEQAKVWVSLQSLAECLTDSCQKLNEMTDYVSARS